MTLNKIQGQTFSNVIIDLQKAVFIHGILYVAISRIRIRDGLKLVIDINRLDNKVKNYSRKTIF